MTRWYDVAKMTKEAWLKSRNKKRHLAQVRREGPNPQIVLNTTGSGEIHRSQMITKRRPHGRQLNVRKRWKVS